MNVEFFTQRNGVESPFVGGDLRLGIYRRRQGPAKPPDHNVPLPRRLGLARIEMRRRLLAETQQQHRMSCSS